MLPHRKRQVQFRAVLHRLGSHEEHQTHSVGVERKVRATSLTWRGPTGDSSERRGGRRRGRRQWRVFGFGGRYRCFPCTGLGTRGGHSRPIAGAYCWSGRGLLAGGWNFRPGQHDRGWGPSRSRCTQISAPFGLATACTAKPLPGPAGGPSRSGMPRQADPFAHIESQQYRGCASAVG